MPVEIHELESTIDVVDQLQLSPQQLDQLVELVIQRLEQRDRQAEQLRSAAGIFPQAAHSNPDWSRRG